MNIGPQLPHHLDKLYNNRNQPKLLNYFQDSPLFLVPEYFMCPLTRDVMRDPVMTLNGQTYERVSIAKWFRHHSTDPLTNIVVANTLIPNRSLKEAIEEFTSNEKSKAASIHKTEDPHHSEKNNLASSVSSFSEPQLPAPHYPCLANELPSATQISPTDISIVIKALLIDCPEVLADIATNKFTDTDLENIVLRIHKKLQGEK